MQQFSFIDLFIDQFESAVLVSGDKLARLQEHFWLYIELWYNAPILLPTSEKVEMELTSSISTLSLVGSNIGALYQSCIYSQKCSWRWASLSPATCRADSNRSIKRSINENYCILLVAYIVVCNVYLEDSSISLRNGPLLLKMVALLHINVLLLYERTKNSSENFQWKSLKPRLTCTWNVRNDGEVGRHDIPLWFILWKLCE